MSDFIGYLALGIAFGLIYGLLALGLVLIYKGSRVLNFAHPFFGLQTAFLCWWLTSKASIPPFTTEIPIPFTDIRIPLWPFDENTKPRLVISIALALLLAAGNGHLIEHTIMRKLRGAPRISTLVVTIALGLGTLGGILLLFARTEEQANEPRTIDRLIDFDMAVGSQFLDGSHIQVLIVAPLLCLGLALFFKRSKFGVAIRAAAENGDAAQLLGVSVDRVQQFTWIVGALLAGIAGLLIVMVRNSLDPATLSTGFLIRALAAALVGGLTSLPGALVGGLFVGVVEQMIEWQSDTLGLTETVLFVVVIGVLSFRPQGLFGQREETEDKVAFIPAMRELPARLRATPWARWIRAGWLMMAAFAVALSLVTGPSTNGVLVDVLVFSIVGVSLTILLGWTGQISLGHWGLVGVGAFSMANLHTRIGVPYLLAIPMSIIVGMVVALIIGLPALRIRGLYLGVATLAFNLAASALLFKSQLIAEGTTGIIIDAPRIGPLDLGSLTNRPLFFFTLAMFGLVLLFARNLQGTRTYRSFVALRENEKAAATLGIGLTKYKLIAFVISGGIASLAGALYATRLGVAEQTTWDTLRSLQLVAMVMIGGLGSLSGSVFGALIVFGIQGFFEFSNPWIIPIGTGILLLIVITRLPGGVAGLVQAMRTRIVETLDELDRARRADEATGPREPVAARAAPVRSG